jgi:hypothetical protein
MSGYILALFKTVSEARDAAKNAAAAGVPAQDMLSPHPVEGITAYLAPPPRPARIGWIMIVAGGAGGLAGYFMQWYSAVIDYPILSGGRPSNSWQVFVLVPYETTILSACIVGTLAWLWRSGLPRPFHPLFESMMVERATQDRYLLVFERNDKAATWLKKQSIPLDEVDG